MAPAFALFTAPGAVFAGLPPEVINPLLAAAPKRDFAPGEPLITEGTHPPALSLILDGHADVFLASRGAHEQHINRVGPGSILGEMSLLTGEPASATVRAAGPLRALTLSHDQVHTLARRYPRLYQNLGANLALRITRADRRAVGRTSGTLTRLDSSAGCPPQLASALAASIAWHTRQPTLLVRIQADAARGEHLSGPGAHYLAAPPEGRFAADQWAHTLDGLRRRYEHILVDACIGVPLQTARVVLLGPEAARPPTTNDRPVVRSRPDGWPLVCGRQYARA